MNKSLLSIDYASKCNNDRLYQSLSLISIVENMEIADYLQEGDIGFKKPKAKKKRPSRRIAGDSGIEEIKPENDMDVDVPAPAPRVRNLDDNFIDDDELQASLARARRAKLKKPKVPTQEEIAKRRTYC